MLIAAISASDTTMPLGYWPVSSWQRTAQALARTLDAAQKPRVIFELIVEPVILGREPDQQSGRFSLAGNDDLLTLGFAQKPGEIVLDFGYRNLPHTGSPNC